MWTSSRTTSGFSRTDRRDGLLDGARLGAHVDQALELGAHARAEQRVVVHDHDAGSRRSPSTALVAASLRAISSATSVPAAGAGADLGPPAGPLHPADDRLADAAAVGRDGAEVEARPAVTHEDLDRARSSISA